MGWKRIFFKVLSQGETINAATEHQTLLKLRRALSDKRQGKKQVVLQHFARIVT